MTKKLLKLIGLGLLLARASYGQMMPMPQYRYTPPPPGLNPAAIGRGGYADPNYRAGEGSYQTPDGAWHSAEKTTFSITRLTVKDKTDKLNFTTATVRQFEIARDTFIVLGNLPGRAQNTKPEFLESVFYRRGMRVLRLVTENGGQPRFFLQLPQLPLQLLPSRKEDFEKTMLPIVAACPTAAASITSGKLGPKDVVAIMQQYDACQSGMPAAK